MEMPFAFLGKYFITGYILAETGLRVGGAIEGIEIGGVDNPVIRDPLSDRPYIPGSSLKGKLRHLLEWSLGKVEKHPKHKGYTAHFCGECDACIIFGVSSDDEAVRGKAGPSRLTVRDAFPTSSTVSLWERWLGENIYTELKSENYLDRITSRADPRTMERVPAGSLFRFEMIFDLYLEEDRSRFAHILSAMYLLENSALGGSGSRGHGQVKFTDVKITERSKAHYLEAAQETVRFEAKSEPEKEYPGRPAHHRVFHPKAAEVDFDTSLPAYLAEQWASLKG